MAVYRPKTTGFKKKHQKLDCSAKGDEAPFADKIW